jgi:hypothetical protein
MIPFPVQYRTASLIASASGIPVEELYKPPPVAEEKCEHAVFVFPVGVRQCCPPSIIARPRLQGNQNLWNHYTIKSQLLSIQYFKIFQLFCKMIFGRIKERPSVKIQTEGRTFY